MNLSISSRMMIFCAVALAAVFTDTAVAQAHGPRAQHVARATLHVEPAMAAVARQRAAGPRNTVRITREPDASAQFASLDFRAAAAPSATAQRAGCIKARRVGPRNTIARCH